MNFRFGTTWSADAESIASAAKELESIDQLLARVASNDSELKEVDFSQVSTYRGRNDPGDQHCFRIGDSVIHSLATALRTNTVVRSVELGYGDEVTDAGVDCLIGALPYCADAQPPGQLHPFSV